MQRVSVDEAVRYGFSMFKYFFGIGLLCLILIAIGVGLANIDFVPIQIFAVVILFSGILLAISASYGAIYKLIADSVRRGNSKPNADTEQSTGKIETGKRERTVTNDSQSRSLREILDWWPIIAVVTFIVLVIGVK